MTNTSMPKAKRAPTRMTNPAASAAMRSRSALAVLGVVVFGSAAAFGYRMVFGGGTDGPPPLIRADTSPTKVMATASADAQREADQRSARQWIGRTHGVARGAADRSQGCPRNANGGLVVPLTGGGAVAPYPTAHRRPALRRPPARRRASRSGSAPSPSTPIPHAPAGAAGRAAPRRQRLLPPHGGTPPGPGAAAGRAQPVGCPTRAGAAIAAFRRRRRTDAPARACPRRLAPARSEAGWSRFRRQKTEGEAQSAFRAAQSEVFCAQRLSASDSQEGPGGSRGVLCDAGRSAPRARKPTNCAKTSRAPAVTASSKGIDVAALALGRGAG